MKIINIFNKCNDNCKKEYFLNFHKTIFLRVKTALIISILLVNNMYIKINRNNELLFLKQFERYVNICKNSRILDRIKIFDNHPYISVCMAALNMKLYIKNNLLSIINQSFQNFEIIIVNDFSNDETENIVKKLQSKDSRIKMINHDKNLGVYRSRIEAMLNAKGEYILLMDPDDMYMNPNLFKEIYNYNLNKNLDIIEFSVYQQKDGEKNIFLPDNHYEAHYHRFPKEIISQPELSDLLYYLPGSKNYSKTICRNIWNKIIRRKVFKKLYKYIGKDYYDAFVITADDMLMNSIAYQYADNYSNILLPGYLYNIRNVSMSRDEGGIELKKIRTINHYQYFFILYKYIKDFNKDRNFLMYEMKDLNQYVRFIKDLDIKEYIPKEIEFLNNLLEDPKVNNDFRNYIDETLAYFIQ